MLCLNLFLQLVGWIQKKNYFLLGSAVWPGDSKKNNYNVPVARGGDLGYTFSADFNRRRG